MFFKLTRRLEELKLLEVLPNNRFRLLTSKSVRWNPTGPLAIRYGKRIQEVFFASDFQKSNEHQDFLTGGLTPDSFAVVKKKIDDVFLTFEQLTELDANTKGDDTEVFWLYTGVRPWDPLAVINI